MKTRLIVAIIIGVVASLLTVSHLNTTPFIFCSEGYMYDGQECVKTQCPDNFIIYKNNCVTIVSENMEIHDASLFFRSVDGKITEVCEVDFKVIPEVETCIEVKSYWISDDNVIEFTDDYKDWNSNLNKTQVEDSVRGEIYDLLSDTDVRYYSINLNHKTGIIEIITSDDSYDSQIKQIISKYPSEVEFDISYSNYTEGIILDDFDPNIDYLIELKNGNSHGGQYTISNAIVQNVTFNEQQPTLIFKLQEAGNGHMQIMIASGLLYPMDLMAKSEYVVLADGIEIEFIQHSPIILEIPFKEGTKEIRIEKRK